MPPVSTVFALLVLSPAALKSIVQEPAERTFTSEEFGFRLTQPEGWSRYATESQPGTVYCVSFYPGDSVGLPSFVMYVSEPKGEGTAEDAREAAVEKLAAQGATEIERSTRLAAGVQRPSVRALAQLPAGTPYEVHYTYLLANQYLYTLQSANAQGEQAEAKLLEDIEASLALFEPVRKAADSKTDAWRALAARCGSEIDWCADWKSAAERARSEGKPVLAPFEHYAPLEVPSTALSGPFMDPDVVVLVREQFVALKLEPGDETPFQDPEVYGMGPHTWGGGLLFLSAEGRVLQETGIFDSSHLHEVARGVLAQDKSGRSEPSGEGKGGVAGSRNSGGLDEAERFLRAGDVERAGKMLEREKSRRAHVLRAELHRLRREGEPALQELQAARKGASEAERADIETDMAVLHMRLGHFEDAERELRAIAVREPAHPRAPEALFWLGALVMQREGHPKGKEWWEQLVAAHAEDRWAWKAAANLLDQGAFVSGRETLAWPSAAALALAEKPGSAPLGLSELPKAEAAARAYLLGAQREDGSWTNSMEAFSLVTGGYTYATTAICGWSLLDSRKSKDSRRAVEKALGFLLDAQAAGKLKPGPDLMGVYSIWSRAFTLWFFAQCKRADVGDAQRVPTAMNELSVSVIASQHASGGWPYVTLPGDPDSTGFDPSSSFLTAGVLLALLDARAAGAEIPDEPIAGGLAFLEKLRDSDGYFRYFPALPDKVVDGGCPEAAGRSAVCALALFRGGASGLDRVKHGLGLFLKHHATLRREWGKELCHTGQQGQGAHYLFYDYTLGAMAARELPKKEREPFRTMILADILATRLADGSFQDMPGLGRSYGTAMALLAFQALRGE